MRRQIRAIHVVALAVAGLGLLTSLSHAGTKSERSSSRPISKLSFDAAAESVEFFKGIRRCSGNESNRNWPDGR